MRGFDMSEQVICVDDTVPDWYGEWPGDPVVKGDIYIVTGRLQSHHPHDAGHPPGLLLAGFSANFRVERGYRADRFAPIKDENLEIFRAMDRKVFNQKRVTA